MCFPACLCLHFMLPCALSCALSSSSFAYLIRLWALSPNASNYMQSLSVLISAVSSNPKPPSFFHLLLSPMTMLSNALLENVTKFNDSNFLSWWPWVQKLLVTIDAVEGMEKEPDESDVISHKAWRMANKKACTIMWACIKLQ